jgi:mono/diheme cytochrome c family protein
MKRQLGITLAGAAVALVLAAGWAWNNAKPAVALPDLAALAPGDPVVGEGLYQEGCAVCHGVNLEGQPDWRSPGEDGFLPAPPHDETGHTWHHADGVLFNYVKLGGKEALARQGLDYNSGMPGFAEQLSDQQIWDILAYIKSTWPERERETQASRSEAERLNQE